MVKCLCKENVKDKYTNEDYIAGNEYEFTEERAAEVTNSKYFEYAKVKKETTEKKTKRVKKSTK